MSKPNSKRKYNYLRDTPWRDLKVSNHDKNKIHDIIKKKIHPKNIDTNDFDSMQKNCRLIIDTLGEQIEDWKLLESKYHNMFNIKYKDLFEFVKKKCDDRVVYSPERKSG